MITVLCSRVSFCSCGLLGPGGVLPYENDGGARRKVSRTPLKGTTISFCGHGFEFIIIPNENSKIKVLCVTIWLGFSSFFFFFDQWPLRRLKATAKPLVAVSLSTLSGTNSQIVPPKRNDEHSRHFYRGAPPRGALLVSICKTCYKLVWSLVTKAHYNSFYGFEVKFKTLPVVGFWCFSASSLKAERAIFVSYKLL